MLAFPGFTQSIVDSILDDELSIQPMEMVLPRNRRSPFPLFSFSPYGSGRYQPENCGKSFGDWKKRQGDSNKGDVALKAVSAPVFGDPAIKDGRYTLALNMHEFKPEEVQVQMDAERMLKITGRREVKSDDGSSYELREYTHHFALPETVEAEQLSVKLEANGHLQIAAPVKQAEGDDGVKTIPIEFVDKQ